MDFSALQTLLTAMRGKTVVCVGDVMVDRFVHGEVARVSPEAPIPVLLRGRESAMLGGVGNVAANIAALGGRAILVAVVGDDATAHEAVKLAAEIEGLDAELATQPGRTTSLKTRFVAAGQQLLRVDEEDASPIDRAVEGQLTAAIGVASAAKAILISDYGKGAVAAPVMKACRAAAASLGAALIVDSKSQRFDAYGAVDLIKPNAAELARVTGLPTGSDAEIETALSAALLLCEAKAILVTRGPRGMSLAVRGEGVRHTPGAPRQVFDVVGAGDTAMAALGLALAGGAGLDDAVALSVLAAGVVVGKHGTATVGADEVIEAALAADRGPAEAKVATIERLVREVARWRDHGLKVGFTNGCFDVLHRGHVAYLAQASAWCDRLVVGLNSDGSVRALKGEGRPVNDLESRALVLAALGSVDLVVAFDAETPLDLIKAVRPDVLIKGADYALEGVVGHEFVQSYGGEVKLAPLVEGFSTTAAIARMTRSA
ncbi:MAG TPA: D-glycero-beta-D-manno-heptose 1-phosphate adenylyltransferase [Caulobacteraceae bacterium]|nr:D-glycero-beta-D-manno-heptose 1-phosphate adenylyltransferase [Caulobacteraceae bacterium]